MVANGNLGAELAWVRAAQGYAPDAWRREVVAAPRWTAPDEAAYIYRPGQLLVDEAAREEVASLLPDHRELGRPASGLVLLATSADVPSILDDIEDRVGPRAASPNHLFWVSSVSGLCPADEPSPAPASELFPPLGGRDEGAGVRVGIVDTGILDDWRSREWLAGVQGDTDDPDEVPNDGFIDPYAGHGTFSAGVLRCLAPAADVYVEGVLHTGGAADQASILAQLGQALERQPDVLVFGAGAVTRHNEDPMGFDAIEERMGEVLVVSPAGNEGKNQQFYPAHLDWVIGVGACDREGRRRAPFSNFGRAADVYAPGVDIVNAFATGRYRTVEEPVREHVFDGIARWSGTSFATPLVAGLVARRLAEGRAVGRPETPREALDALVAASDRRVRGKAVLLP